MPDVSNAKPSVHPFRLRDQCDSRSSNSAATRASDTAYAELAVTSNFTFLNGASHPEEMVYQARALGYRAIAITDTNTLAGIVRAHTAAKEIGVPLVIGCRLHLNEPPGFSLLVYPTNRPAYARLCRLLTLGKRRAPKGECDLTITDVIEHQENLLAVALPPAGPPGKLDDVFVDTLHRLRSVFDDDRLSLAAKRLYTADDALHLHRMAELSSHTQIPLVAINDAHYHIPQRRPLQDVVTCIRHGCTIEEAGARLHQNAERYLKSPEDMVQLFAEHPEALMRSVKISRRATAFNLDELRYEYPVEPCPPSMTAVQYLRERAFSGAETRYPKGVPDKVSAQLEHELDLIEELHYEAYFLTCYDIVKFARSKGILFQGRGGAANSTVCYCLGITEVDPNRFNLLFERFVSRVRNEPPDIDIDFEHERREEVIQYLYEKYGRERAALTAEVISYRGRSAVRDVSKAMGLSLDCADMLAKNLDRWYGRPDAQRVADIGLNPNDPVIQHVINLTQELIGFPRHLSQHVGGFVITRSELSDLVPIENAAMEDRTVIEWDKDDIDAMGMLKVDCLGLGMLTCIRKSFKLYEERTGKELTIAKVVESQCKDDPVYRMMQHADTIGVFQIESRAQMSMLPRLRPEEFYDLVIEVAIVRPGPIQGGMVHPYLRRRSGEEKRVPLNNALEEVLGRTLGIPIFQEQAMQLAIVAGGFTPDEADSLRRAMASWKRKGNKILEFGQKLIQGMIRNGYEPSFAERCFNQIKGFSEYGFPESHAASFALLVYVSSWLKRYQPATFAAALINSQPMGFYQPAQLVRDAREHGVEVLPCDVNHSTWDCTLEANRNNSRTLNNGNDDPSTWGHSGPALRLGMRLVKGLSQVDADRIPKAVEDNGAFTDIATLWRRSGASVRAMRALARGDAFRSMGLDRQSALWQIRLLRDDPLPLFEQATESSERDGLDALPSIPTGRQVLQDYEVTGLSLKAHPMSFLRKKLNRMHVIRTEELRSEEQSPQGRSVAVAGIVLMRQRPGTASGVVFITLEDETGIANLIIWPRTFEQYRRVVRLSCVLLARGRVERQGEVVHVHAHHLESLDSMIPALGSRSRDFH